MKAHDELRSNIRLLISDHTHLYEHEKLIEGGTVPGLIQQIRSAISVSGDRGGSGGKPVPVNMPAYTLLERISRDLQRELLVWHVAPAKINGKLQVEGAAWAWSKLMLTKEEHTLHALELTRQWILSTESLFQPVRETELLGKCPACGYDKCTREIDGEECVVSTLIAVNSTVTCQYCASSWAGEQLHYLRAALEAAATEDPPVLVVA